MAIQKKSLIGNLTATKKAIVATNVAATSPVVSSEKLETASRKLETSKKWTAKESGIRFAAKPGFLKTSAKTALKTSAKVAAKR